MEKILVIDDDDSIRETLQLYLTEIGYEVIVANNGEAGIQLIEEEKPDLILSDLKMAGLTGIDVLKKAKELDVKNQVVLMTAFEDMKSTIIAMQLGAYDYIEKPLELSRFNAVIKRALESRRLSDRLVTALPEDDTEINYENSLIGRTQSMREIFKKIGKISSTRVNVLIEGESGTGKELITKVIHYTGITKNHPFVAVNCTALSESLLESELFGHVKGSFTGAIRDKKGKFELAGEGTIFLDEISEITPNLQVKLLRVLQEREFEKVGGEVTIPMNSRVVAATNRNLNDLVKEGKFREDLFYRLKVFTIDVPPLRERKDDIPSLVIYFLKKINKDLHKNVKKIPYEVMEMLQNNEWVGNVRELENILLQAVVLSKGDVLERENILLRNQPLSKPINEENEDVLSLTLADVEKKHIQIVLDHLKWDKQTACKVLGISKPTLYNKIHIYGLTEKGD